MFRNKTFFVKFALVVIAMVTLVFATWWAFNHIQFEPDDNINAMFSDSYWILALIGGGIGIWSASKWGSYKSVFGRSILLFSTGLLLQVYGQVVYTFYALVKHIEAPYPSVGDIGFFGSVLCYIVATYLLAKTAGARLKHVGSAKKVLAVGLPSLLLVASYAVFLKDYQVDFTSPVTVVLDFAYPLGQAIFVSLALLTYFLSRGLLGGVMKKRILFLLAALLVQYAADYSFLYRFNRELWYPGDISDLIYLVAYMLMAIALLRLGSAAQSISKVKQ